ncbi:TAXI family TRAP transporter solute-binding subunit [Puniceibacterium sp. IMCC21224]|uniref:TAXI family TRAP transporter solute-binding subunit n=1 Tax=Puniceibacterium sp. IMCC21224 TaxID=1618204 RepID=UPI00064D85C7|nr:TAXI family TRAP transporter solute-binding subunit [Puniceibacterium sp. IMCC21224]KMK69042.1 TRAP transporter solute receptor, TAXI family [Puniceibacterium sp. IMCC21224]
MIKFLKGSFVCLAIGIAGSSAQAEEFVSIGTGGITGVYYPIGGAICRLMNKDRKETGIRCSVESTGGSIYNINNVRAGELDFGVVQSDWQYFALKGESSFADQGPFEDERAVLSLYTEAFTVLARADSSIKTFAELKGHKVNLGEAGSGGRATMELVMNAYGLTSADFTLGAEFKSSELPQALCDGKIDAGAIVVGHPAAVVTEAMATCPIELVSVSGAEIQSLIDQYPYYAATTIPGGMYQDNADEVATFGVGATLITSAREPDASVHALVKSVFENIDEFKALHPALGGLEPEGMSVNGLSAPLHPGAAAYYAERGWK